MQYLWKKFKVLSIKSIHTKLVANLILTTLNIFDKLEHRRSQDFWLGGPVLQITCNDATRNFRKKLFWVKDFVKLGSEAVAYVGA